mmetsp:Transcript_102367/g.285229  ORF Transcript_102367/g.285229 Transcript_102367/m.285229 type:complete len:131 (-) Transcript_102367:106-498(-)
MPGWPSSLGPPSRTPSRGSVARSESLPALFDNGRSGQELLAARNSLSPLQGGSKGGPKVIYKRTNSTYGSFYKDPPPDHRMYPWRCCGNNEFSSHFAETGFTRRSSLDTRVDPVFEKFNRSQDWHATLSA